MDGDYAARREVLWDRCGESLIGIFSPRQVQMLRERLADYQARVERALDSLGDDTVIATLLATEADRFRVKLELTRARIIFFLTDLPEHGGVVELHDSTHRMEWVWMLQELRIAAASAWEGGLPLAPNPGCDTDASAEFAEWSFAVIAGLITASERPPVPDLPELDRLPGNADIARRLP
ncbi:hypothetical protein ACFWY9_01915 [Amycolatopsis sp. NPDC059027]|uniref:hypothetical protein n=1 Tax=unclassified Amycolatopsis TaxID=2618356 RepID=UPI0036705569